jgi:hypothetical protein
MGCTVEAPIGANQRDIIHSQRGHGKSDSLCDCKDVTKKRAGRSARAFTRFNRSHNTPTRWSDSATVAQNLSKFRITEIFSGDSNYGPFRKAAQDSTGRIMQLYVR